MPFELPAINDNPDGWGPSSTPEKFSDLPYAPFEKKTFIGRMADWSTRAEQYRERYREREQRRGPQMTNEAFVVEAEDVEGFSMVDTQKPVVQPGWDKGMRGRGRGRGRGMGRGGGRWGAAPAPVGEEAKFLAAFNKPKAPQQAMSKFKKNQQANFATRWNDQKQTRYREASVDVRPEWNVQGQITVQELTKLSTEEPPEPREVYSCGTLRYYDKSIDRATPKTEKPLQRIERSFFKVSTSDDPLIAKLHDDPALSSVRVYATDTILSVIMASPRSSISWDLVVNRVGDKLFLDKRPDSMLDYVTCMETANDFGDEDPASINHMSKLMAEATYVNQNFSQQVLSKSDAPFAFKDPSSPFVSDAEDEAAAAPVGYRYHVFKLGPSPKEGAEDTRVEVLCRCELDAITKGKQDEDLLTRVFALNEIDAKLCGGIDWRQKLDSQRGAVLANELKNNSCKLAKWTLQAMLAGADLLTFGYVSRVHTRDSLNHVILGTQKYKPKEFATHINLNFNNAWGILKAIIDLCLQLDEGKYLLLKDPNKPVIRLYSIPPDAFDDEEPAAAEEDEGEEEEM